VDNDPSISVHNVMLADKQLGPDAHLIKSFEPQQQQVVDSDTQTQLLRQLNLKQGLKWS